MRPLFNDSPLSAETRSAHGAGASGDAQRLLQAKLESLAEFAAGAGHEINNPLAVIINRAQRLMEDETDPVRRRELAAIGAQAYRIRDMIGDVMLFARPPQPQPEICDVAVVVRDAAAKLSDIFAEAETALDFDLDDDLHAWADPLQLTIVVAELLKNAAEATGPGGQVRVTASSILEGNRRFVRLCVTDDGPGLSELDREHLFDPFYSGRQAGRGLGFGLSKCWRIVDGHGGRIEVAAAEAGETTFRVDWPAAEEGED